MNEPGSTGPDQGSVPDGGTDSGKQPAGAGKDTAAGQDTENATGDIPPEPPTPLPGYEHV